MQVLRRMSLSHKAADFVPFAVLEQPLQRPNIVDAVATTEHALTAAEPSQQMIRSLTPDSGKSKGCGRAQLLQGLLVSIAAQ